VAAIGVMGYQTGKIVCVVNGYNIISLTYNVESEGMMVSLYKVSHWSNCPPTWFYGQRKHFNMHTNSEDTLGCGETQRSMDMIKHSDSIGLRNT